MLENIRIGKRGNLVAVQIIPATKNRYETELSKPDALLLADVIAAVLNTDEETVSGGGALGSRPITVVRLGSMIILSILGKGKSYQKVDLSEENAREVIRQLRIDAL